MDLTYMIYIYMSPPKKDRKIMMIVESSKGFKHPCHIVSRFWFPLKMGHHPKWKDPQQKRQGQPLVVAREKIWLVVTGTMEF